MGDATMEIVKTLSIKQPWAWCIAKGLKPVENRSWPTKVRGRILIHAGKSFDHEGYQWLIEEGLIPPMMKKNEFALGGIVGEATIVDCVDQMDSVWFFGPYGFVLANARESNFLPLRGQLGFFNVNIDELSGLFDESPCKSNLEKNERSIL